MSAGSKSGSERVTNSQRKATLLQFLQAAGQEVLVSTSAAEEGIDVPSCEFVVCYTTVQSGRERMQKQGRARATVAKFVEFAEMGSDDLLMQDKARQQQRYSYGTANLPQSRHTRLRKGKEQPIPFGIMKGASVSGNSLRRLSRYKDQGRPVTMVPALY